MNNPFIDLLKGKVVIVGIGNTLRGDDAFGPLLVSALKDKTDAICIDAGTAPENYVGKIVRESPDTVLVADVIDGGLRMGDFEILDKSEILQTGFSTHDLSPKMVIEFIEDQTRAQIYMLGVQAKHLNIGDAPSTEVLQALKTIETLITEAIGARDPLNRTDR